MTLVGFKSVMRLLISLFGKILWTENIENLVSCFISKLLLRHFFQGKYGKTLSCQLKTYNQEGPFYGFSNYEHLIKCFISFKAVVTTSLQFLLIEMCNSLNLTLNMHNQVFPLYLKYSFQPRIH